MGDEEFKFKLAWQERPDGPWSTARGDFFDFTGSTMPILIFSGSHGTIIISPAIKYIIKQVMVKFREE